MKSFALIWTVLALLLPTTLAADVAADCRVADDARVAAMTSADPGRLAAAFSDDLIYVHSSGHLDTKASLIAAITSGKTAYHAIDFEQREFREVVPGLVLVHGRCYVKLGKAAPYTDLHFSFLASYRLEKGAWRFLAWQSCKLAEPAPAKP
ncbi:MAG TPA: nuclear transport factor 2 family protein [Candidatus Limnocylindria bacterium]|jgi:hypothetical protein|nr:nuclear transport factor 2 family protein [Candidatus Limnocylindria bacterium]